MMGQWSVDLRVPPPTFPLHPRTHSHARTVSYGSQFALDATCVFENKSDVAAIPTPTVIMSHVLFIAHPFACVHYAENGLRVDGAKALVPALAQMTHMTTLNLSSKSRIPHAHTTAVSSG